MGASQELELFRGESLNEWPLVIVEANGPSDCTTENEAAPLCRELFHLVAAMTALHTFPPFVLA